MDGLASIPTSDIAVQGQQHSRCRRPDYRREFLQIPVSPSWVDTTRGRRGFLLVRACTDGHTQVLHTIAYTPLQEFPYIRFMDFVGHTFTVLYGPVDILGLLSNAHAAAPSPSAAASRRPSPRGAPRPLPTRPPVRGTAVPDGFLLLKLG